MWTSYSEYFIRFIRFLGLLRCHIYIVNCGWSFRWLKLTISMYKKYNLLSLAGAVASWVNVMDGIYHSFKLLVVFFYTISIHTRGWCVRINVADTNRGSALFVNKLDFESKRRRCCDDERQPVITWAYERIIRWTHRSGMWSNNKEIFFLLPMICIRVLTWY